MTIYIWGNASRTKTTNVRWSSRETRFNLEAIQRTAPLCCCQGAETWSLGAMAR